LRRAEWKAADIFHKQTFIKERAMRIIGALVVMLCVWSVALADLKVTRKVGAGGHSGQSTVYIKGARERSENPGMTSIQQCDLRRTIQINEHTRRYMIVPDSNGETASAPSAAATAPQAPHQTRRGAIVTHTVNITDTGERKQMFGYTARHIKTATVMDAPPEACSPGHFEMESDGWYIDLAAGFSCETSDRPVAPSVGRERPDCQDQVRFKRTGAGKLGFPVIVTTKFKTAGGGQAGDADDAEVAAAMSAAMTSTQEVTDISTVTLDPALFDIPTGYTEVASMQELYGGPSGMMGMPTAATGARPPAASESGEGMTMPTAVNAIRPKQPGAIRVGVVRINNRAGGTVSLDVLRSRLVGSISDPNVEAIPLDSTEPAAADSEAKQKDCDFVLYTDLSALKQAAAGKVGGMFGRVTGVSTPGAERYESRVDFRLTPVGGSSPQLESNATAKEEGADTSVGAALEREAKAVVAAARKKR
jgi:hypothetical protein